MFIFFKLILILPGSLFFCTHSRICLSSSNSSCAVNRGCTGVASSQPSSISTGHPSFLQSCCFSASNHLTFSLGIWVWPGPKVAVPLLNSPHPHLGSHSIFAITPGELKSRAYGPFLVDDFKQLAQVHAASRAWAQNAEQSSLQPAP